MPPENQFSSRPSASLMSQTPTPENPGVAANAPGQVETPSMSEGLRPASPIASRAASTVSDRGERPSLRPTSDCPIPLITASLAGFIGPPPPRSSSAG